MFGVMDNYAKIQMKKLIFTLTFELASILETFDLNRRVFSIARYRI